MFRFFKEMRQRKAREKERKREMLEVVARCMKYIESRYITDCKIEESIECIEQCINTNENLKDDLTINRLVEDMKEFEKGNSDKRIDDIYLDLWETSCNIIAKK